MRIFKITALLLSFFLASCASGPKFTESIPPKKGMSVIYVYRPWTYDNGAASPPVQLDGMGDDKLVNGSYLRFETKPGKHTISIPEKFDLVLLKNWPNLFINLSTEPDKEYYLRYSTEGEIKQGVLYTTVIKFNLAFQIVPKEAAIKELQR